MSEIKQYNFTVAQIQKLMDMQDTLNTYIHPEWKTQGFNWNLAIIDECMEIHGHLGWKWWKKDYNVGLTEANKKQVQLEVIDILHFIFSLDVQAAVGASYIAGKINSVSDRTRYKDVEWITSRMLHKATEDDVSISDWAYLAHATDLTEQQILETYTQKYVLNKFRQDHGYKDGSYVKEWLLPGAEISVKLEDNEVLALLVKEAADSNFDTTNETALYNALELSYNDRLNK